MSKIEKELWKQAQEKAKEVYEEENGGSWEDADKYEREDWVFAEYEKLGGFKLEEKQRQLQKLRKEFSKHKMPEMLNGDNYTEWYNLHKEMHDRLAHKIFELSKEIENMAQARDSKGRFISNKGNNETTNTILNQKGNDTMMNKTNTEKRMDTLKANGIDTSNFFDLSMRVPFGAEVKIVVDGKEMIIPASNVIGTTTPVTFNSPVIIDGASLLEDSIAQSIIDDGYIKNSKLFRRWITAQTFRMLNYQSYRNINRKGWEACMKDCFSYEYQFDMITDELHTLAKLQKEDPTYFAERTMFFNGNVVVALLEDYLRRLKKYVNKQMRENPRNYRGQAYVKLAKYGNVLVKDLNSKVYLPICNGIAVVKIAVNDGTYADVEKAFKDFMSKYYNKLPYETTKCATWKDAFKGSGSYYTLQNLIRFHGVVLKGWTNKYDSENYLNALLHGEYKNEVWRFHQLLVDTIAYNNFDLKKSIANGNKAPGTKSDKAERYYK